MAAQPAPTFVMRLKDLFSVPFMFTAANVFFVKHFLSTLFTSPFSLSISKLRSRAFASVLTLIPLATPPESPLFPFLAIQKESRGLVLDVGPGTGINMEYFDKDSVSMIYGAEPSEALHPQLNAEVKKQSFEGKYKVLNCGAEWESLIPALKAEGLITDEENTAIFDTIICCKVLCSVPNQSETIKGLVKLLKPGGKIMINEHIRNRSETPNGTLAGRAVQRTAMALGWETVMCGCDLERDTAAVVEAAGEWEDRRLTYVSEWATIPFVFGWFEKKLN